MTIKPEIHGAGPARGAAGTANSAGYGLKLRHGVWSVTRHGVFYGDYLNLRAARRAMDAG